MGNSKVEITKFYKMYNDVINRRTERRLVKGQMRSGETFCDSRIALNFMQKATGSQQEILSS